MKTAIVDVDNTLWNFCPPVYELAKKFCPEIPPPEQWHQWKIFTPYLGDFAYTIFDEVHCNQEKYLPFSDAKLFLNWLKERYKVVIVSHRNPLNREFLVKWLDANELYHDDVAVCLDKTKMFTEEVGLVIDDCPRTLRIADEKRIKVCGLVWPWNNNLFYPLFDTLTQLMVYLGEYETRLCQNNKERL